MQLELAGGGAAAIEVTGVGYHRDQRVTLATSDEVAAQERARGKLVAGPVVIEVLATINEVFPGARVLSVGLPRSPRP